jgi:hypothetical protein
MSTVKEIVARSFSEVFGREVVSANDSVAVPRVAAAGGPVHSAETGAAHSSEEKEARSA